MQQTFQITISGQVQGVGFRPKVFRLAQKFRLNGSVYNNEDGVCIHLNTGLEKAKEFLKTLLLNPPQVSNIRAHMLQEIPYLHYDDFRILNSEAKNQINIPLTPDFGICDSCTAEIRDKDNRRYGYAFTTCTDCGPRYALTTKFPFERVNTTLREFKMCAACQAEYEDPKNRRFHSQTNSCPECGIQLELSTSAGVLLSLDQGEIIEKAAELLKKGSILALKNTSGYLLCCDPANKSTLEGLRLKKQRKSKPFALLYPSLDRIKKDFEVSETEEAALISPIRPIVILRPKTKIGNIVQDIIAPGLNQLGVMLPSSALLRLLVDRVKAPIVATSGNIHGSPILARENEAFKKLEKVADYFLNHNMEVAFPQDDSVLRFAGQQQITLRRSRGLAPNFMGQTFSNREKVLAMGAHLKSTFAWVPNSNTYISPYFGNLDSFEVCQRLQQGIVQYQNLFEASPATILIDEHPQYQSSLQGRELAETNQALVFQVQHHQAHFSSVLGEHDLFESDEKILGVVWDGTGIGNDMAIWGGEFFNYENRQITRLTHFGYVDWIALDKMAKEPRLSLLSMLPENKKEIAKPKFLASEWKIYTQLLETNKLKTSSVGRLFDAAASLLGLLDKNLYEGEAAMLLENLASTYKSSDSEDYLPDWNGQPIPSKELIGTMYDALINRKPKAQIAFSFIYTLALIIIKMAKQNNYRLVACSGGVFQNAVLVNTLVKLAKKQEIMLKFNRILSSNDENISFGQLCYYQHLKN